MYRVDFVTGIKSVKRCGTILQLEGLRKRKGRFTRSGFGANGLKRARRTMQSW